MTLKNIDILCIIIEVDVSINVLIMNNLAFLKFKHHLKKYMIIH